MENLGKMKETTVMSSENFKDMTYGEYLGMITKSPTEKQTFLKALGVESKEANTASASTEDFTKYVFGTWSARSIGLEFNAELGKSVLEFFYDVVEIAKSKYNYEMSDDDMTFALTLIDYSIRKLFDDGASVVAPVALLTSVFGRKKAEQTTEAYNRLMNQINSGAITKGAAGPAVAYLSFVQALMDRIENDGSTTKEQKLKEIDSITIPSTVGKIVATMATEIITATRKRVSSA
jgi:hypothetical protein